MTYGNTEESRRDRMGQRKMEKLDKKLGPGPHFGGLITDSISGRLRALEERMTEFEKIKHDIQAHDKKPHCPICGCETATEVVKWISTDNSGVADFVIYLICDGCSVMFKKKDQFFR